jgi:hypothetical protein
MSAIGDFSTISRLGLAAEEISSFKRHPTLSLKTRVGWGTLKWECRSAKLWIHSQNHFCPAVEMHIVAL